MDPNALQRSSFIPKRPLASHGRGGGFSRRNSANIFFILSITVALVVLLGTGVLFFYERHLSLRIDELKMEFAEAEKNIDRDFFDTVGAFDVRLQRVIEILTNHVAASEVFALLEANTLRSVYLTEFQFGGTGSYSMTFSGIAPNFESLALQADELRANAYLTETDFGEISLDESGNVVFGVSASVDPSLIRYASLFAEAEDLDVAEDEEVENSF